MPEFMPQPFQLLQSTKAIFFAYQYAGATRDVLLKDPGPAPIDSWMGQSVGRWDGESLVVDVTGMWLGDARGRWEGDTLVVETTNFNGKVGFRGTDERLRLVERFTRKDRRTLIYEFTVENPGVFTQPWTARLPMTLTDARIYEYACHEGNYALVDILRGARYQERNSP